MTSRFWAIFCIRLKYRPLTSVRDGDTVLNCPRYPPFENEIGNETKMLDKEGRMEKHSWEVNGESENAVNRERKRRERERETDGQTEKLQPHAAFRKRRILLCFCHS